MREFYLLLRDAFRIWLESQAFVYGAALAFFTVFSIAPVVIVAVAVVGVVLGDEAASGRIMAQLHGAIGPQAAEFVQMAVRNARLDPDGTWATVLGVILIMVGATTVFAQMQKALNAIWGVLPKPDRSGLLKLLLSRLLSLAVLLAIGFVLLVSLLLSVAVQAVIGYADGWLPMSNTWLLAADVGLSLLVVTLLFGAMFRLLPDVVLRFRDVFPGALLSALLFTLGRALIAQYLAHSAPGSSYGAAGSLVVLLIWVNYSSLILLFGAAFNRAWLNYLERPIQPRRGAVRVQRQPVDQATQAGAGS